MMNRTSTMTDYRIRLLTDIGIDLNPTNRCFGRTDGVGVDGADDHEDNNYADDHEDNNHKNHDDNDDQYDQGDHDEHADTSGEGKKDDQDDQDDKDKVCSWPKGMACVAGETKTLHLLRWHCRRRKALDSTRRGGTRHHCKWDKVPYPVTASCTCSCK